MTTIIGLFCGFMLGYGVRLFYILATGRDIPICKPREEVFRLRREADRIERTANNNLKVGG